MERTVLKIEGMSCDHCKSAVTQALKSVTGVEAVEVDLTVGEAKVSYDPSKASIEAFKAKVEDAGYEVRA